MVEKSEADMTAAKKEFADDRGEGVELMKLKNVKQKASPFINQQRSWDDDEHFTIPADLQKGIVEELGFNKPSNIQAVAVPLIAKPVDGNFFNLIAQSKNGSGKTGAFSIGSVLRVDPKIQKCQVLVVAHVRELSSQIAEVYEKITKYSDITVSNFTATGKADTQIVVTTLGKLNGSLTGRGKGLDLSALKCLVIDEADVFFGEAQNLTTIQNIIQKHISKLAQPIQYVLFSATYPESAQEAINQIVTEAQQIQMKKELLQLNHISQFELRCQPKKKPEFIMDVFSTCSMTQTVIFVNTKKFAEVLHSLMQRNGYKANIIFGDMSVEERDEMIGKFRSGEVHVIITTNMLARGIDVPEVEIVINFDVPTMTVKGQRMGDPENYLHRIGRTGRFGTQGIAVSIYDRDEDKTYLDQIVDHYKMADKLKPLENAEHLKTLLEDINKF